MKTQKTNATKATTKANAQKVNTTKDFTSLFEELTSATSKYELVEAMKKAGLQCTTAPTTTPNTNDLYLQFNANKCGDVSRLQITSKSLKLWATENVKNEFTPDFIFESVNDGSARKFRATFARTLENFSIVMNKFSDLGIVKSLTTQG